MGLGGRQRPKMTRCEILCPRGKRNRMLTYDQAVNRFPVDGQPLYGV